MNRCSIDPQAPGAYGAQITYDIPLNSDRKAARDAVNALPERITGGALAQAQSKGAKP